MNTNEDQMAWLSGYMGTNIYWTQGDHPFHLHPWRRFIVNGIRFTSLFESNPAFHYLPYLFSGLKELLLSLIST